MKAELSTLVPVAQRLCWWQSPEEALTDSVRFAAQVMVFGNWEDVQTTRAVFGDEHLKRTLRQAPAGVFDLASWHYWHYFFGMEPVPGLPCRKL
ncbi:MAG TPA: hypothetical protein VJ063_00570 [Verrucomicrobiae bacterium]|nr:hypothetical protein [Verrucomicrobiae bacterium]